MNDYDAILAELEGTAPASIERVDAGPAARRAAAGMPPEPRMADPNPSPPIQRPNDVQRLLGQPAVRWEVDPATVGAPGAVPPLGQAGSSEPRMRRALDPNDPIAHDPLAQGVIAGTVTGPLGGTLSSGLTRVVGPAIAPVAAGGAAGAAASKSMGGSAKEGAALGALFPGLRVLLGGVGEAEMRALAQRGDSRLYNEIGRAAGSAQAQVKLQKLGAEKIANVSREIGLPTAPRKLAVVTNDLNATGQAIGDTYSALDAAGHGRPLGGLMSEMDKINGALAKRFGAEPAKKLFAPIRERMDSIWETYGKHPDAVVPLGEINKLVGGLEKAGFGPGLPEKTSAVLAREMAGALNRELDTGLATAARDPNLAPAVNRLADLNSRYKTLKAIEPAARRMDLKSDFGKPTQGSSLTAFQSARRAAGDAVRALPRAGDAAARALGGPRLGGEVSAASGLPAAAFSAFDKGNLDAIRSHVAQELFGQ